MIFSKWFELDEEPERFSWENCRKICSAILEFDFEESNAFENFPGRVDGLLEDVRFLAELILWGDKFDPSVVRLFQDMQVLTILQRWTSKDFVPTQLKVQVMQTISIVLQNIQESALMGFNFPAEPFQTASAYILSSPDAFDLTPAFINCIRTIFSRLDAQTVSLVFDKETANMPLLWLAVDYMMHPDSLVRTTARSVLINTLARPIAQIHAFVQHHGDILSCLISECFVRKLYGDEEENSCRQIIHAENLSGKIEIDISPQQDDLVDIFSFLDDLLDSAENARHVASIILEQLILSILSISDDILRLECAEKAIIPATHEVYLTALHGFLQEVLNQNIRWCGQADVEVAVFAVLMGVFRNASFLAHLKAETQCKLLTVEAAGANDDLITIADYVHAIALFTMRVSQNPASTHISTILQVQNAFLFFLTRCSSWENTLRAVLRSAALKTYGDIHAELEQAACTTGDESRLTLADKNGLSGDIFDTLVFAARMSTAHAVYQLAQEVDSTEAAGTPLGVDSLCSGEKSDRFGAHVMFFVLAETIRDVFPTSSVMDPWDVFAFRKRIPRTERIIETSAFSGNCGMIGIRCQIVHRVLHCPRRSTERDWGLPEFLFASDLKLPNGALLYFFFAQETLYFVEPSLENLGHGRIVFQLPAFYCSTIVFSSTDTEMTIECQPFDGTDEIMCQIKVDFTSAAVCKNVAESLLVYIQKVREKGIAGVRKLIESVGDFVRKERE